MGIFFVYAVAAIALLSVPLGQSNDPIAGLLDAYNIITSSDTPISFITLAMTTTITVKPAGIIPFDTIVGTTGSALTATLGIGMVRVLQTGVYHISCGTPSVVGIVISATPNGTTFIVHDGASITLRLVNDDTVHLANYGSSSMSFGLDPTTSFNVWLSVVKFHS